MKEYTLAQAGDPATERERLALLQRCYDPWTIAKLQELGVGAGWRCVEVGAGGGSIARWLAERVGTSGSVVAVDLDLALLERHASPTLSLLRLDVRRDELPGDADLVHCRLLLEHLPEYRDVLKRMVGALRPGGWLVVTDTDFGAMRASDADPAFDRVAAHFMAAARAAGWNPELGPSLARLIEDYGLADVAATSWQTYDRGGDVARLFALSLIRLRDLLVAQGAIAEDVDDVARRLTKGSVGFYSLASWTAWGRAGAA
jgi:2-polyprenyl-3-methyl-5-hydroxy-6-metoxy-1,4-benzoquinol methylase